MPRVKGGTVTRARRKKTLKLAQGYYGSKSTLFRPANEQVMKSLAYAYRDRRQRKRDFRTNGLSYSRFISGLRSSGLEINRKILAELAVNDAEAFSQLVDVAKQGLTS